MTLPNPQTLVSSGLTIAGGVWALATALAGTLPKDWAFTRFCARIAYDLRGIHQAAPSSTPEETVTHITFTGDK